MPNKLCFKDYKSVMFSGYLASFRGRPCLKYGTNTDNFINCFAGNLNRQPRQIPQINLSQNPFTFIAGFNSTPVCVIYDNNNNLYISTDVPNSGIYIIKANTKTPKIWGNTLNLKLPVAMAFNSSYTEMYVTDFGAGEISVINVATGKITKTITNSTLIYDNLIFPNGPLQGCNGASMDATFSNLYVTNTKPNNNNVICINLQTFETTLVANITYPILMCNNPQDNSFYVTSLTTNTVYQITIAGVLNTYITGGELSSPRGITFDNNYKTLYVTNYNSNGSNNSEINYISVYNVSDINSPTFLYNIVGSVLMQPRGLCFNSNNDSNLIISNFQSYTLYSCNLLKYIILTKL